MSNKWQDVSPKQAANTPRRLRSGTHYGDNATQLLPQSKRDNNKRTAKESSPESRAESTLIRGDKTTKTGKTNPSNHEDKSLHRPKTHGLPMTCDSPKQKGQTLKAILENIEPDFPLRNKSSKRKTLRDLLDQKMFKNKEEQKSNLNEVTKSELSDKSALNAANNHHQKNHTENDYSIQAEQKNNSETPLTHITAHTQTAHGASLSVTMKEELPDDYWAMRKNYTENVSIRNSSVELRIKAGISAGSLDEHSQTFRISCSRPENCDKSPAALHHNMKPDIVLKVRPRSSSMSALSRTSSDCKRASGIYKTTGRFHGHQESQSTTLCTSSPLRFLGSSSLSSGSKTSSSYSNGIKQHYFCSSSNLHTHGVVLHDNSIVLKHDISRPAAKSPDFDQLGHHDVVEESNLPPVANTVELLSEPHEYYHGNKDLNHDSNEPTIQLADYTLTPSNASLQIDNDTGHDRNYSETLELETLTRIKTEPCVDNATFGKGHEEQFGQTGDDALHWRKRDNDPHRMNVLQRSSSLQGGASPVVGALTKQEKDEVEEDEEWSRFENDEGDDDGNEADVRRMIERRHRKSCLDRKLNTASALKMMPSSNQDESGSRRRRKGRPTRRAKMERRWQTADLCLSPRGEGDEAEGEEEGDEEDERYKCRADKPASRNVSHTTLNTRKGIHRRHSGTGTRHGEAGTGARRPRKSVDLEALWANPQLDTHAFLLWASENRCEVQKQNPGVSPDDVEDLLSSQWRMLPFSGKLQFLCRARDACTDPSKHSVRKKKASILKQDPPASDCRSVYDEFLRLPQERQKDLLRKWLRFFQKMLPRLEYQDFINDFKKACKSLQLRPVPARRKNARLRNLDPSHYHMLFEKIRETRPRVISVYNKRKAREEELLRQSFSAMARRLIAGHPWPFVRGCRSKLLGELLKDIQQLEVEEVLAQIDLPLSLTSADLPDPFTSKDLNDAESLTADNLTSGLTPSGDNTHHHSIASNNTITTTTITSNSSNVIIINNNANSKEGYARKCPNTTSTLITTVTSNSYNNNNNGCTPGGAAPASNVAHCGLGAGGSSSVCSSGLCGASGGGSGGPGGGGLGAGAGAAGAAVDQDGDSGELPDCPFVASVMDALRHASDLPLLDQRSLDTIFLGPPARNFPSSTTGSSSSSSSSSSSAPSSASLSGSSSSRSQTSRDSQFQNSATYRRTLLYKHIQPLLDSRGMPLPSSALFHSHTAQYFFPDDR